MDGTPRQSHTGKTETTQGGLTRVISIPPKALVSCEASTPSAFPRYCRLPILGLVARQFLGWPPANSSPNLRQMLGWPPASSWDGRPHVAANVAARRRFIAMRCAQPRRRTQRNQKKSNVVPVPRFGAVRNHGGTRNATKKQTQMALRYAGSGLCAVRNHDGTRSATQKKMGTASWPRGAGF